MLLGTNSSHQLWITFASMLATFNMTKTEDSSGRVIEVNDEFDDPSLVVLVAYSDVIKAGKSS